MKSDAQVWAREQERSIDRGEMPGAASEQRSVTIAELLHRYRATITPRKRGSKEELCRIKRLLASDLARYAALKLPPAALATYRDRRLEEVKGGTIRREFALLRHCLEVARKEWGLPLATNPIDQIRLPEESKPRERRLNAGEADLLAAALNTKSALYLKPFLTLAVETGMRRGELLSIRWTEVDLEAMTVRVSHTKNGHPRRIPLTPRAVETLRAMSRESELVFQQSANAVRLAWERLRQRAGLTDLRMHDLRHEAVSRFFEYGLSMPEVALISGHRDRRMLDRYTHLRPETVAQKLAGLVGK